MDREQRRQFVRDHRTCVFGYPRQGHGPAMTVVYYVMDGDDLLVSADDNNAIDSVFGEDGQDRGHADAGDLLDSIETLV